MRRAVLGTLTVLAAVAGLTAGSPSALAAESCPNAAYRTGPGASLPDCRAWEQVTPVDKGGNQPNPLLGAYPGPDGDRVLFASPGDMGGSSGVTYATLFSSVRGSAWTTFGLNAQVDSLTDSPPRFDIVNRPTLGYSEDRSKALVVSLGKYAPGAVEGDSNLYVRDTASGSYTLAVSVPGSQLYSTLADLHDNTLYAASADFKHFAFYSQAALTPDATPGDNNNLYLVSDGRITLAGRDVDGTALQVPFLRHPSSGQRLVSDDGRRVTFTGSTKTAVYQRVDGASTVLISRSHRTGDDPAAPVATTGTDGFWPSADGATVTFSTGSSTSTLTDDGPPSPFYRWRAGGDGGSLTNLLAGVSLPWTSNTFDFRLRRVSQNGRYLWFTLTNPDADPAGLSSQLDVLDTQDKRITVMVSSLDAPGVSPGLFDGEVQRFSSDGTKLAILSSRELTGYDQSNPKCEGEFGLSGFCKEVFTFDAARPDAGATCLSCGVPGTHSMGEAGLGSSGGGLPLASAVADDGKLLFDTPQPLAAADANTLDDVYERLPGQAPALLSSGQGSYPATVLGLTPSGRDAFFYSADPLVAQDNDNTLDVYDARVDGGIAAQQIQPRDGDSCPSADCRGAQNVAPALETPGSVGTRSPARRPRFSVARVSAAARRRAVSSGRLRVSITVGAAGRLAGRLTARLGGRSSSLARGSLALRKAGRFALTLTLSRAARRALAHDHRLAATLSVSYSHASRSASQSFALDPVRGRRSTKGGSR